MVYTISIGQLKAAFLAFGCAEWRNSIEEILKAYCTYSDQVVLKIPQPLIDKLIKEGTDEQKKYAESFGITLEDRNPFVKRFNANALSEISGKLFEDNTALQIGCGVAIINDRADLCGRSLFVSKPYEVKLIDAKSGGTIIEIIKK